MPSLKRSVWKARPRATCIEVSLLRTDLTAAVEGVKVSPGLALGTRIAFKGKGEASSFARVRKVTVGSENNEGAGMNTFLSPIPDTDECTAYSWSCMPERIRPCSLFPGGRYVRGELAIPSRWGKITCQEFLEIVHFSGFGNCRCNRAAVGTVLITAESTSALIDGATRRH